MNKSFYQQYGKLVFWLKKIIIILFIFCRYIYCPAFQSTTIQEVGELKGIRYNEFFKDYDKRRTGEITGMNNVYYIYLNFE